MPVWQKQSQGKAEWNCFRGEHHHESHWINRENKAVSEGKWGTLTEVRAAEGHLRVGWGTGTGPAGGCQP